MPADLRVVSLLPAATEIVAALGCADRLVGVSHECDFPVGVERLPQVTQCPLHGEELSSAELDQAVRDSLASTGTLYTLDEALLRDLQPDVLITQRLCDLCAVSYGTVAALAESLPKPPRIVNLEPGCLADIFDDIRRVGEALQVPGRAAELVDGLRLRVERVRSRAAEAEARPRTFLMEWIDPPFCGGHWNPELVQIAGGAEVLGRIGEPSRTIAWDEVIAAAPEVLVIACCGYPVERALRDLPLLQAYSGYAELPAVREGRIYVADGNSYFARPGPRIVDSLEILAEVLHPELFESWFPDRGTVRVPGSV